MLTDLLHAGQRVLVVDEWIETGAEILAVLKLIPASRRRGRRRRLHPR